MVPSPLKNKRSCLVLVLLALVMIGVAIWLLTDFVSTPSTGTMPPQAGNSAL